MSAPYLRSPPAGQAMLAVSLALASCLATRLDAAEDAARQFPPDAYVKQVVPLLSKYCSKCHGIKLEEAGLGLHLFPTVETVMDNRERWSEISEMLDFEAMPPEDEPQPTKAERRLMVDWINSLLSYDCDKQVDPGRVTLRRLNRAEYDNTIRDLIGLDLKLAKDFPSDDVGEGFDNIGDVLSLPPLLFEKYVVAAEKAAHAAISDDGKRIVIATPESGVKPRAAARRVLERFAKRAYRRPATEQELDALTGLVEAVLAKGDSYERGLEVAVTAVLISPHFLFRVEADPQPKKGSPAQQIRDLNDYEMASRLSYFLWSSMPDEQLFSLADKGQLQRDDVLRKQVRRMLADPKAQALVTNFGGQWLNLRVLDEVTPDPKRFTGFSDALRKNMQKETELFFAAVVREDLSILDFLTGRFTFLNQRLARHYGLQDVKGDKFRRVKLASDQRMGVLTHASILTLTSNPTRTSPVKRGKWILENVLGTPPPEPPENVPPLEDVQEATPHATLREQMVMHRKDPVCASCHRQMDDLGFGFENFDAVGRWRERDAGKPINTAGKLPSGEQFVRPAELIDILGKRKTEFSRSLARKMLTYALGRGLQPYDQCAIDTIVKRLEQDDYRFSALVTGIVTSKPFRKRRAPGGES